MDQHGFATDQFPVSAYVGSSKNLKDLFPVSAYVGSSKNLKDLKDPPA